MQIRKSRLKQIIQEEVANAKFIDISEEAINQEEEAEEIANQAQEAVAAATGISISGDDIVPCGDVRRDIYDADGNYVTTVTDIAVDCDFDGVADSPGGSTTTRAQKQAALNNNGGN